MPGRRRSTASDVPDLSKTLVLGIIGKGEIDAAEVEATMNDLFQTPKIEKVECIFALTDDALGDSAYAAWQFVAENVGDDLAVAAVTNKDGNDDDKALHEEVVEAGARLIGVGDQAAVTVADELVKAKTAGADARLVIFWVTEEDEKEDTGAQYAALETAVQGGVTAFNACEGMDTLNLGDDGAAEESTPEPAAEEPPRRARRARGAAEPEAVTEPAAPVEVEEPPTRRRSARAAAAEPTLDEASDEAQVTTPVTGSVVSTSNGKTDLSEAGVSELITLFARVIAKEVAVLLAAPDAVATEAKPARRARRS